jgi:hypothetical protein
LLETNWLALYRVACILLLLLRLPKARGLWCEGIWLRLGVLLTKRAPELLWTRSASLPA